jgi:hypothetical protein
MEERKVGITMQNGFVKNEIVPLWYISVKIPFQPIEQKRR